MRPETPPSEHSSSPRPSAPAHPPGRSPAPGYRWNILGIVTVGQSMAALVGLALLPLAPFIQEEFGITRAQLGLLISALYVGAMLSSLPAGWLTDALGPRVMLVLSQVVVGVGIVLLSQMPAFVLALALMPLVGIGYGGINPMSTKAIMDWFPGRIRGTAISIKQTGFAAGGAIGALILPSLAVGLGWRTALLLAGLSGVMVGLVGGWFYRDAAGTGGSLRVARGLLGTYRGLMHNSNLLVVVLSGIVLAATQLIVTGYLVLFLAEHVALSVVAAGAMLSLVQFSGAVGRVLWGVVSDQVTNGRRRPVLVGVSVGSSTAMLLASLLGAGAPVWAIALCAILLGLTAVGWNGVFSTLVGELGQGSSVAGAAAMGVTANFLGVIIGPPIFGLLVDLSSYELAWRIAASAGLLNIGLLMLLREGNQSTI